MTEIATRVPQTAARRRSLTRAVEDYVRAEHIIPPQPLEILQDHGRRLCDRLQLDEQWRDFVTILVSNELWRPVIAALPYERRLLLLPQCLRDAQTCPAELDEFGVLCDNCGACVIGELQAEAVDLGYVVLVAEGMTVVAGLLKQGKIDAVIGVSCFDSLHKSFPLMTAQAVPGIAVPLLRDGCINTTVDTVWLRRELIARETDTPHPAYRPDLDAFQAIVASWFDRRRLEILMRTGDSATEQAALDWLACGGKRWRPLLTAATYQALTRSTDAFPRNVERLAVAIECFHKASLVHDDIEDDEAERYGRPAVHREYGVPFALNVGDYLIGQGYALIAACETTPDKLARLHAAAADGHRSLSLGQGSELAWHRQPQPLAVDDALEMFRLKTAPAFGVALCLGAIYGDAEEDACDILGEFSEALGIAYQIQDDCDDFSNGGAHGDAADLRPSVLLALTCEAASAADQTRLERLLQREDGREHVAELLQIAQRSNAGPRAHQLLKHYRSKAIRSLQSLHNTELKGLLFRLVARILPQV